MYFHFSNSNKINQKVNQKKSVLGFLLIFSLVLYSAFPAIYTYAEGEESAPPETEAAIPSPALEASTEVPAENPPDEETVIETGDAVSATEVTNKANTNVVESQNVPPDLEIENENDALVKNDSTAISTTGENTASGTSTTTITTGDAYASTDITNIVNTNIVDSEGGILSVNDSLGDSSLDLRANLGNGGSSSDSCNTCNGTTTVENENDTVILNNVSLSVSSGENSASSTATTTITTGDAYAGTNVVNVVNTNIVNSNYFLLVFNNLGSWSGDIIFGNSEFFSEFLSGLIMGGCNDCGGSSLISNNNKASVSNSISVNAETGGNIASGEASNINTGNAVSVSNVHNSVNQNFVGGSSFFLIIKILGGWTGNIFNLPTGIGAERTADGIVLYSEKDGSPFQNNGMDGENVSISNTNLTDIENNISLAANTGNNKAISQGESSIQTGSAYTAANVVNVVNTSILSSNWIRAFVNILGNWSGNISFGQPDLWVGSRVESLGSIDPGETVTIYTTIANKGDAPAHDVNLSYLIDSDYLSFVGGVNPILKEIPVLNPSETREYSYKMKIAHDIPQGDNFLHSSMSVTATESDGNLKDNSDELTIVVYNNPIFVSPLNLTSYTTTYPNLSITKTNDTLGPIKASSTVNYTITVRNTGGRAFESVLIDELKDENGNVISKQRWNLGTILEEEEITVTYTANFTASTTPGIYTNFARVEALGGDYLNHPALAKSANSPTVSTSITVEETKKEITFQTFIPIEEPVEIMQGDGTLRPGPQASSVLQDATPLEFNIPDQKKNKMDFKNFLASVFSVILF